MKVKAKNETIAKLISHPSGPRFNAEGISYWPPDQFTTRRIRDGDITVVEEAQPKAEGRHHERRAAPAVAHRSE